jgi:hypothetical protein
MLLIVTAALAAAAAAWAFMTPPSPKPAGPADESRSCCDQAPGRAALLRAR